MTIVRRTAAGDRDGGALEVQGLAALFALLKSCKPGSGLLNTALLRLTASLEAAGTLGLYCDWSPRQRGGVHAGVCTSIATHLRMDSSTPVTIATVAACKLENGPANVVDDTDTFWVPVMGKEHFFTANFAPKMDVDNSGAQSGDRPSGAQQLAGVRIMFRTSHALPESVEVFAVHRTGTSLPRVTRMAKLFGSGVTEDCSITFSPIACEGVRVSFSCPKATTFMTASSPAALAAQQDGVMAIRSITPLLVDAQWHETQSPKSVILGLLDYLCEVLRSSNPSGAADMPATTETHDGHQPEQRQQPIVGQPSQPLQQPPSDGHQPLTVAGLKGSEDAFNAALFNAAAGSLCGLSSASGCMPVLIRFLTTIATTPCRQLNDAASAGARSLLATLRHAWAHERIRLRQQEYNAPIRLPPPLQAVVPVPLDAKFDKGAISGSCEVIGDGKAVKSTIKASDSGYALLDVSFRRGKAHWEFKLDEDTSSQCTCFGAATKPVEDATYESSKSMFMLRAYNGNRYGRGGPAGTGSDGDKVNKGDTVRFDLDFDEGDGVMRFSVNGKDRGVFFEKLRGLELFPAVCFYSGGRQVSIVSCEGIPHGVEAPAPKADGSDVLPGVLNTVGGRTVGTAQPGTRVGVRERVYLSDLTEVYSHVATGTSIGRGGDVGAGGANERKLRIAGSSSYEHSLGMYPRDGATSVGDESAEDADNADSDADNDSSVDLALPPPASQRSLRHDNDPQQQQWRQDGHSASEAGDSASAAQVDGTGVMQLPSQASADAPRPDSDGLEQSRDNAADSSDSDDGQAAETPAQRKSRAVGMAVHQAKRRFASASTAVWWIGRQYECINGGVALNDSVTNEQRADSQASPVVFEIYGDGRCLWTSTPVHASRVQPQPFTVSLVGVDVLQLVTRVTRPSASKHAAAVWVEPALVRVNEWECGGWRNDRHAMRCGLCGCDRPGLVARPAAAQRRRRATGPRGASVPAGSRPRSAPIIPAEPDLGIDPNCSTSTSHGFARAAFIYVRHLALECVASMSTPVPPATGSVAAAIDLEQPFCSDFSVDGLQSAAETLGLLYGGVQLGGISDAQVRDLQQVSALGVVACSAATIRRAVIAGLDFSRTAPVSAPASFADLGAMNLGASASQGSIVSAGFEDEARMLRHLCSSMLNGFACSRVQQVSAAGAPAHTVRDAGPAENSQSQSPDDRHSAEQLTKMDGVDADVLLGATVDSSSDTGPVATTHADKSSTTRGLTAMLNACMDAVFDEVAVLCKANGAWCVHSMTDLMIAMARGDADAIAHGRSQLSTRVPASHPEGTPRQWSRVQGDILDSLLGVPRPPPAAAKLNAVTMALDCPGVVDFNLDFPFEDADVDPDHEGSVLQLESLLLLLQLHARAQGWKSRIRGQWPAQMHLILEVPQVPGITTFLNRDVPALLSQLNIQGWSFPQGLAHGVVRWPVVIKPFSPSVPSASTDGVSARQSTHVRPVGIGAIDVFRAADHNAAAAILAGSTAAGAVSGASSAAPSAQSSPNKLPQEQPRSGSPAVFSLSSSPAFQPGAAAAGSPAGDRMAAAFAAFSHAPGPGGVSAAGNNATASPPKAPVAFTFGAWAPSIASSTAASASSPPPASPGLSFDQQPANASAPVSAFGSPPAAPPAAFGSPSTAAEAPKVFGGGAAAGFGSGSLSSRKQVEEGIQSAPASPIILPSAAAFSEPAARFTALSSSREAQQARLDKLFDEVVASIEAMLPRGNDDYEDQPR